MGCFLDELVQHLVGDVFNHVGGQLVDEPGQHLLLVGQIAVVETGDFVLKVDERRDVIDAVFPGHVVVVDLDEGDPFAVALVVNVLQLGQDPLRLFGVVVVCPPATRNYYIEAQMSKHLVGPPKETGKCQLTEEDGQVRGGAGQRFQRLGCYVFDHVLLLAGRVLVLHEPLEDVLLAQQITFVDDRYAVAVVDQSGQRGEAVLFGQFLVGDFDESDAQLIGLVVNVLQFAQDLLALFALRPIWQSRRMRNKQQQKDVRLVIWPLLHVESHSSIRKYIEVIYRIGRRRSPYRGRSSPGFWR